MVEFKYDDMLFSCEEVDTEFSSINPVKYKLYTILDDGEKKLLSSLVVSPYSDSIISILEVDTIPLEIYKLVISNFNLGKMEIKEISKNRELTDNGYIYTPYIPKKSNRNLMIITNEMNYYPN